MMMTLYTFIIAHKQASLLYLNIRERRCNVKSNNTLFYCRFVFVPFTHKKVYIIRSNNSCFRETLGIFAYCYCYDYYH